MDVHFNAVKIKYDVMNRITNTIFDSKPIKSINIFINLDNLYGRLKNTKCNTEFQHCGANATKQLISNTLNLIGHYRQWGVRKHVDVKVYAYCTFAERSFSNKIFVPEYRSKFVKSMSIDNPDCYYVNTVMKDAHNLLMSITHYIDGVYIIDSHFTEPSTIPLFIQKDVRSADWNFIITRDKFEYQYANIDRFTIVVPKGDDSFVVNEGNIWKIIAESEKFDTTFTDKYPPKLYVLALAAMGNTHRSIPKLKRISWVTIFKYLDKIAEEGFVSEVSQVDAFIDMVCDKYTTPEQFINSITVTNISTNYSNMDETTKEYIKSQLVDVPDYENLLALNQMPNMFLNYPINLKFLTDNGDSFITKNQFIR